MKKIFIEDARVDSFLIDLATRLRMSLEKLISSDVNKIIIIGVGESGTQVAQRLVELKNGFQPETNKIPVNVIAVQKNSDGGLIAVVGSGEYLTLEEYSSGITGKPAFIVLDGVCRSGQTMTSIYQNLRLTSKCVWTYAIAVSADSVHIPTWYGCLYEGNDYVVLARDGVTPNTPLYLNKSTSGEPQFDTPALVLRPPIQGDPDFNSGDAESLKRYTSEDRFFDSSTRSKSILVLEWNSEPVGYIAYHIDGRTLWVDYIVACKDHGDKKGIGTVLYYHVENYAKLRRCENISLWAIEGFVEWYEKRGFSKVYGSKSISIGINSGPEIYHPMTHKLVSDTGHYNI